MRHSKAVDGIPIRPHNALCQPAFFPGKANLDASASSQTAHAPVMPPRWQRGEKIDDTFMTLQQHLRHRCCPSEVAVDLKDCSTFGRVRVHEVRARTYLHQHG
jgi:hypothetical protein